MFRKQTWVLVGLAVVLGGGALLVGRGQQAEARFGHCRLDGVWILQFGDGLFYEQFVTNPSGFKGTFETHPIIDGLSSFGGEAPGVGGVGNIRRISRDTWEFNSIAHGRTLTMGTELGMLTSIQVFRGVSQLIDCDTQAITVDFEIYSPDADADGDGFPDEGSEPIAVFEDFPATAKRV